MRITSLTSRVISTPGAQSQYVRDVVPLPSAQSSTPHLTRSQRQLLSEPLHAGNLKAYLNGISLVDVQAVLSRHFLQYQQDRSIFSFLVDPGDGVLPHEAASAVLGELASKTEDVAVLATLAYRLIKKKLLYDFVTGRVILYTIVKRRTSRVRRDKSDTQRHAGGLVTALQRRPQPLNR